MNLNTLLERVRALLAAPQAQWPLIAAEPATLSGLYRNYILVLAAIPPLCGFIKVSLIGYAWHRFTIYRLGVGAGLSAAIVHYVLSLAIVYVMAVVVDALATSFGGRPDRVQALKAVGYSYTASWICGLGQLLPWMSAAVALAGALYGIYLLYLGLPFTMRIAPERATGYTMAVVVVAVVLIWIVSLVTGGIAGLNMTDGLD
jgi:hypothetical protein